MLCEPFNYQSYKSYLTDRLAEQAKEQAGQRSRLARAIPCHTAYVSQVLNGLAHFSLEQGDKINAHLGHSDPESLYFLTLIQYERAGTASLKSLFKQQLRDMAAQRQNLKNRLKFKKSLSIEDQTTYYSSWHYAAVHVLVSVPGMDTKPGLGELLKLPLNRVAEILDFLCQTGLLTETNGHYAVGVTSIHLGADSPNIIKHHTNWRLRAIDDLERRGSDSVHYSSVVTMSVDDGTKVRAIIIKAIEDIRAVVSGSKDERGFCYALDFFPLSPV